MSGIRPSTRPRLDEDGWTTMKNALCFFPSFESLTGLATLLIVRRSDRRESRPAGRSRGSATACANLTPSWSSKYQLLPASPSLPRSPCSVSGLRESDTLGGAGCTDQRASVGNGTAHFGGPLVFKSPRPPGSASAGHASRPAARPGLKPCGPRMVRLSKLPRGGLALGVTALSGELRNAMAEGCFFVARHADRMGRRSRSVQRLSAMAA